MATFKNAGGSHDGVVGTTTSHNHNGVAGTNSDPNPHSSSKHLGNGVFGQTRVPDGAGVLGLHESGGVGVAGFGHPAGIGVVGISAPPDAKGGDGVLGLTNSEHRNGMVGRNDSTTARASADAGGNGVFGFTQVPDGAGVFGAHATTGIGVGGLGLIGLWGGSVNGVGVMGISAPPGAKGGDGVQGITNSELRNGVYGVNLSTASRAPKASAGNIHDVVGVNKVFAFSGRDGVNVFNVDPVATQSGNQRADNHDTAGNGVLGFTNVPEGSGVLGVHGRGGHGLFGTGGFGVTGKGTSAGVWGIATDGGWAGLFNGPIGVEGSSHLHDVTISGRLELTGGLSLGGDLDVQGQARIAGDLEVNGDIRLPDKDIAERFVIADGSVCPPGTVMVIAEGGSLAPCSRRYDKRAIGVVAGAGTLRTAITLGASADATPSVNIALVGTAFCRVDADVRPIGVGDLITTSDTAGHGMKAVDPASSFGAVIGKALAPLESGRGLIPIILALQ